MDLSAIKRLVPGLDGPGNVIRESWDRLRPLPGGKVIFSRMVGTIAPYTGNIHAIVKELAPGYAQVTMKDRRAVRNHLQCVHAVALANLAELTGNIALSYGLPDDARFIVAGMNIEYVKKARGTITGVCRCPIPETSERAEYEVVVELLDSQEQVVVRATLRSLVGPKRKK